MGTKDPKADLKAMAEEMREEARFLNASADAIDALLPTMTDADAQRMLDIKADERDIDGGWPCAPPSDPRLN